MVDGRRLAGILRRVGDDVSVLRGYGAQARGALGANAAALGHVKYLFITAIEGCIDAAHHVLASEGWAVPDTNADRGAGEADPAMTGTSTVYSTRSSLSSSAAASGSETKASRLPSGDQVGGCGRPRSALPAGRL